MKKYFPILLIYIVGLLQGIALVTFPAAGTLLTSSEAHNLTNAQYGSLFIPMNLGAIISALLGGSLANRIGLRPVFFFGLVCNAIAMALFAFTEVILGQHGLVYVVMLFALLSMGFGFGSTLTTLNAYIAEFFAKKMATALTGLHSLLGVGTAIAPLLFSAFETERIWWGDPLLLTVVFSVFSILSLLLLKKGKGSAPLSNKAPHTLPRLFWLFLAVVFLYGICETIFGNWSTIYLTSDKGLQSSQAAQALALFWGMVTFGRILITLISAWFSPTPIYAVMPLMILGTFLLIPSITGTENNILVFGLAGLACSGMLPLSIGFAQSDYPSVASIVSGRLIAFYMAGYGVAAYGVGLLTQQGGLSLNSIFLSAVGLAALLAFLTISLVLIRNSKA